MVLGVNYRTLAICRESQQVRLVLLKFGNADSVGGGGTGGARPVL